MEDALAEKDLAEVLGDLGRGRGCLGVLAVGMLAELAEVEPGMRDSERDIRGCKEQR